MNKLLFCSLLGMTTLSIADDAWKQRIPEPIYAPEPEFVELYWKTWEIAYKNIRTGRGIPQSPYIDEGFSLNDNWIWDTCFMIPFCKYAPDLFPGVESLNNFYKPLYDGAPSAINIHIPDNPPLFAWAEYQNVLFTADTAHLKQLLLKDRYLQRHFEWFDALDTTLRFPGSAPTCLRRHPLGFFWEGGRSGMDNTPRGRTGFKAKKERPNNPEMLWVDALAQQGLSAYCIARMAELIDEPKLAEAWDDKWRTISDTVNSYYWDGAGGFYYDIHCTTRLPLKVVTPAAFWPVLARMSSPLQTVRMVEKLTDSSILGGHIPWVTLARNDPDFNAENGEYWRGSMWLPTAYMGIKSIEQYGYHALARENATAILRHQLATYKNYEPHTIWECYAPNTPEPAKHRGARVRPNFCGWSALGPISLFIENIIGIREVNAFTKTVRWDIADTARETGLRNLRFGGIITTLVCKEGRATIVSNAPYTLHINGKPHAVSKGETRIILQ